jgi:hypothetical protein
MVARIGVQLPRWFRVERKDGVIRDGIVSWIPVSTERVGALRSDRQQSKTAIASDMLDTENMIICERDTRYENEKTQFTMILFSTMLEHVVVIVLLEYSG